MVRSAACRRVPALPLLACGVLGVMFWSMLALLLIENSTGATAMKLGSSDPTARLTVIGPDVDAVPLPLSPALSRAAREAGATIAYSRWYETGLVSVFDPATRISVATPLRSDQPGARALVATDFPGSPDLTILAATITPTRKQGRFTPTETTFEGRPPALLFTPEALPFGPGIYRIFGVDEDTVSRFIKVFERSGMRIVGVSFEPDSTPWALITRGVASPFGMIAQGLGAMVILGPLLTAGSRLGRESDRYRAWVSAGAAREIVRRNQLLILLRPGVAGTLTGTALVAAALFRVRDLVLSSAPYVASALASALVLHALTLAIQTAIAIRWNTTRLRHVVPH